MDKIKIFNDPVYGFVSIPRDLLFSIIEHPFFQRLRRIKQLGLTDLVYPGAHHSRFHHTLGAVHLMTQALESLKQKGVVISDKEMEAAQLAILLHDIGHGPFSHALEGQFLIEGHHEDISLAFMNYFNQKLGNKLNLAIQIFQGKYHRPFLCQLVSGQLDVDRLDYLCRDSFYTGVSEGVIGSDRIIKMMSVVDENLVVDEKGIYSIEKYLIARNLMYWQVYLHKTVLCAEILLIKIIQRVRELLAEQKAFNPNPVLGLLSKKLTIASLADDQNLEQFASLDDIDLLAACKEWRQHSDTTLSYLCRSLLDRRLYRVELINGPLDESLLISRQNQCRDAKDLKHIGPNYLVFSGEVSNTIYHSKNHGIKILFKNGALLDFTQASEQYDLNILTKEVQKHYICYPKSLKIE